MVLDEAGIWSPLLLVMCRNQTNRLGPPFWSCQCQWGIIAHSALGGMNSAELLAIIGFPGPFSLVPLFSSEVDSVLSFRVGSSVVFCEAKQPLDT